MQALLLTIIGYLLGSISFSFIIAKAWKGIDIRKHGSGNAGATNTLRVLGVGPAILVLSLDIAKGVLAVWLARWFGTDLWLEIICGLAVIVGHNWPIFFGFRGGKGIATTIGVVATLCFWPALYAGIIAVISIVITRYVSLGSLILTGLLPVSLLLTGKPTLLFYASLAIAAFAFYRHRSNIKKLIHGQENKLGAKR